MFCSMWFLIIRINTQGIQEVCGEKSLAAKKACAKPKAPTKAKASPKRKTKSVLQLQPKPKKAPEHEPKAQNQRRAVSNVKMQLQQQRQAACPSQRPWQRQKLKRQSWQRPLISFNA